MELIDRMKPCFTGFIGLYKSALQFLRYYAPQLFHISYISTFRQIRYRSMSLLAEKVLRRIKRHIGFIDESDVEQRPSPIELIHPSSLDIHKR